MTRLNAIDMPSTAAQNPHSIPQGRLASLVSTDVIATCALMFTILSGKLSFAFLFPDRLLPTFLFEFRLWGVVALAFLLRHSLRESRHLREPIFVGTICLLAFLIVRSLGLENSAEPILDALYLSIEVAAIAVLARKKECVTTMGMLSLGLAVLLFLLALWGVKNEDLNGAGWAPIGGPITFYRIEYLGLCVALYCYLNRPNALFLVLISVFFFATWSSLSKIAIVASIIALAPVYVVCFSRNQYKQIALVSIALLTSCLVWQVRLGSTMQLRVAESAVLQQGLNSDGIDARQPSGRWPNAFRGQIGAAKTPFGDKSGIEALPPGTRALNPGPGTRALNPGQDMFLQSDYCIVTAEITLECRSNALTDRSGRLLMFAEAMRGFAQSPIVGNGLGQYVVRSINVRTDVLEAYNYPHNILAEMAFTGGAVALMLFLSILGYTAHLFANAPIREPRSAALVCFGIFMFLSALAAGNFYDLRLFLCLCVGLSVMHTQSQKRPGDTLPR